MSDVFSVRDKYVLITGGSKGVGFMIAEAFMKAGSHVCIASRNRNRNKEVAKYLTEFGTCDWIEADLSTEYGCTKLVDEYKKRYDALDVLVNNSGVAWGEPFEKHQVRGFEKTYFLNVIAPFVLTRAFATLLENSSSVRDEPSRVLMIGSIAALKPQVFPTFSYDASKAALHHLSIKLANELAPRNITVNVLALGFFPSDMTDSLKVYNDGGDDVRDEIAKNKLLIKRTGRPIDVGGAAIYLSSSAGSYVTGSTLLIDGGFLAKL